MKASRIAFLALSIAWTAFVLACGSEPAPDPGDPATADAPAVVADAPESPPVRSPDSTSLDAALFSEPFFAGTDAGFAATANEAPTLLALGIVPSDGIRTNDDVTAVPNAADPEGDPLTFRYRWRVNGKPVRIDAATLPASHFRRGDRIELTVEASDGDQTSFPLRLDPIVVMNSAPKINTAPGPLDPDGTFRYTVGVEDADSDHGFHYELRDPPEGMRIDAIGGEVVWTPRPDQAGVHTITIAVDDRHEGTATQSFDLTIEFPPPQPPAAKAP